MTVNRFVNKLKKLSSSGIVIKGVCVLTMLLYLYCVFNITLIERTEGVRRHVLRPLWEISTMIRSGDYRYWSCQICGNLIMLFPLGFMLPMMFERFRNIKAAAAAGFVLSLFIEFSQYFTGRGLFESDDIIHNTLGACLGCIIYGIIFERLIDSDTDTEQ